MYRAGFQQVAEIKASAFIGIIRLFFGLVCVRDYRIVHNTGYKLRRKGADDDIRRCRRFGNGLCLSREQRDGLLYRLRSRRSANDPLNVALRKGLARMRVDLECAPKWVRVTQTWERQEKIRLATWFGVDPCLAADEEPLKALYGFSRAYDSETNAGCTIWLKRTMAHEAEAD